MSLRTCADEQLYQLAKKNGQIKPLHEEKVVKEFNQWVIVQNRFPYSVAFKTHHMLLPKREVSFYKDLSRNEIKELRYITDTYIQNRYDVTLENTIRKRSNMVVFHIHLLEYYKSRSAMYL